MRRADLLAVTLRAALLSIIIPLSRVAQAMVKEKIWFSCGFARAEDFARERLGRSRRWLGDLAALHQAMKALPELTEALTGTDGERPLGPVAALLIGRIASPTSVASWIVLARRSTVRQLRSAISRSRDAGADSPPGAGSPAGADSPVRAGSPANDDGAGGTPSAVHQFADDDPAARSLIRVPVPRALLAAFDEALDLYRAVEGSEASVTSFIEALVAESSSGDLLRDTSPDTPHDTDSAPLTPGPSLALRETALARSTGGWRHLPSASAISPALALAEDSVASLEELSRRAGSGGPAELIEQMRALVSLENEIQIRLGTLLAGMADDGAWSRLRFAGIGHYAEERLGLSRTAAEDRARATRALRRFPLLRDSYERDRLGLDAVLIVARILDQAPVIRLRDGAAPEEAWVARASETTVKRLRDEERLLRRRAAGGVAAWWFDPERPQDDAARPAAPDEVARRLLHPCDDAEWHASLRRGPGTARRRIYHFGTLAIGLGGLSTPEPSSPATALIPAPDVFLRLRLPADLAADFLTAIEAARRPLSDAADAIPWDAPWPDGATDAPGGAGPIPTGPDDGSAKLDPKGEASAGAFPSFFAARTFSIHCRRVPAWVGLLAMLEEFVMTWDTDARCAAPANDRIHIRDGWRCTAPGCSSRRNLESHHVVYRSRGGGHGGSNRTSLCRFHHQRGEHGGLASCSGVAPLGLVWRLGREGLAEWYRNERRLEPGEIPIGRGLAMMEEVLP